jgi:hypothetical protein
MHSSTSAAHLLHPHLLRALHRKHLASTNSTVSGCFSNLPCKVQVQRIEPMGGSYCIPFPFTVLFSLEHVGHFSVIIFLSCPVAATSWILEVTKGGLQAHCYCIPTLGLIADTMPQPTAKPGTLDWHEPVTFALHCGSVEYLLKLWLSCFVGLQPARCLHLRWLKLWLSCFVGLQPARCLRLRWLKLWLSCFVGLLPARCLRLR